MTIYDRVLALIKEQNLTVKQVERECELANATIRRWATQTPNVESVRRVAHRLSVTLDYLVEGGSSNTTPGACDGVGLSEMESDLIAMFRLLPMDAQTRAATQKAAPPRKLKPKAEPLAILRSFDLVVNLFSVPLMKRRKPRVESPKTLENRAMGHSPIGFADLSHCSPPVLPRFAAPPRTPRTASARPNPRRSAPKSPDIPKTRTL